MVAGVTRKARARRVAPTVRPLVALLGNPNTGKTTLFNALTGERARVGNYPGVTVERRVGRMKVGAVGVDVLDLPGTYSLSARSAEEQIALDAVLGLHDNPTPSLVVVVVEAGQLVRNLYLVLQLCELEVPLVVVLNMIDEVAGAEPDPAALSTWLGAPVVATSARSGQGVAELRATIAKALERPRAPVMAFDVPYPAALIRDAELLAPYFPSSDEPAASARGVGRARALALWALGSIDRDDELAGIDAGLRARCLELQAAKDDRDIDTEIIASRYAVLDREVPRLYRAAEPPGAPYGDSTPTGASAPRPRRRSLPLLGATRPGRASTRAATERIDRVVLHPVAGFAIFVLLMLVLFQALFSWSDPAVSAIEELFGWLGSQARATLPHGALTDLLVQGVIGGVGNVIVFLPQIVLLFFLLGLLEDTGYMSRAAYLMDRVMRGLGLHGRAFVPMLSGCACAVPAILATRTMERQRDRLLTMLVIPLMTCSARLPVYTLIIAALFPPTKVFGFVPVQGLLMVAMYVFSTVLALTAAAVLGRTVVKGKQVPLLLELPPYRMPTARNIFRQVKERAFVFLKEAGTVILACTVGLWVLLSYPKPSTPEPAGPPEAVAAWEAERLEQSFGGRLGRGIEPAIAPLGFDWKIGVGLVGAFAAREVFVSTMGVVYGVGDADAEPEPLRAKMRADRHRDGTPSYTPLVGLSLMVFFAIACQCISTLAVVRRETKSWKWPAFLFAYTAALAYLASFLVFQGGRLLGLS